MKKLQQKTVHNLDLTQSCGGSDRPARLKRRGGNEQTTVTVKGIHFTAHDCNKLREFVSLFGGTVIPTDVQELYLRYSTPNRETAQLYTLDSDNYRLVEPDEIRKRSTVASYTSLSDGKYIFVDHDRTSNWTTLAWDIVHLLGHMFQWNANAEQAKEIGISVYGLRARRMAVKDFRGASAKVLAANIKYELDANDIAYSILMNLFGKKRSEEFSESLKAFIHDDVAFITDYYYSGLGSLSTKLAENDPVLGPALRRIPEALRTLPIPDPAKWRFRSYDLVCVPVLHQV